MTGEHTVGICKLNEDLEMSYDISTLVEEAEQPNRHNYKQYACPEICACLETIWEWDYLES